MQNSPLVSIICICYNHSQYVIESLESVKNQSYNNIEILIADDCSNDISVEVIKNWVAQNKTSHFIQNSTNLGNTKTFNKALSLTKGDYIIDFACDDVLVNDCVEKQVNQFKNSKFENLAIVYGNLELISADGNFIKYYYDVDQNKKTLKLPPSGDIYESIVGQKEKICSVTAMIKRKVFDKIGSYDENLAYEDLDFWIRAAREYNFDFIDSVLAKKRELPNSLGSQFFIKENKKINYSTYLILQKTFSLNKTKSEHQSLLKRVHGEMYSAFYKKNWKVLLLLSFLKLKISWQLLLKK
ncbi:MAG: glycosyltransferase [Bacteroidota bacterium]